MCNTVHVNQWSGKGTSSGTLYMPMNAQIWEKLNSGTLPSMMHRFEVHPQNHKKNKIKTWVYQQASYFFRRGAEELTFLSFLPQNKVTTTMSCLFCQPFIYNNGSHKNHRCASLEKSSWAWVVTLLLSVKSPCLSFKQWSTFSSLNH